MFQRIITSILIVAFTLTSVVTPSSAQVFSSVGAPLVGAQDRGQPQGLPLQNILPVFNGIKIYPQEPFRFDFLVDGGQGLGDGKQQFNTQSPTTNPESQYLKLIKYFMSSLTIPEGDLWVNLSPDEPDRIVPSALGQTEMGKDLLYQDYLLKQLTASLLNPESESGKNFGKKFINLFMRNQDLRKFLSNLSAAFGLFRLKHLFTRMVIRLIS